MPIGKWRFNLKQEDIPIQCAHVKVSPKLNMLGVTLTATKTETLRINGEFLQRKVWNTTAAWKGRSMQIKQRSVSINTYLYPKIWHKARSIHIRMGDIKDFKKAAHKFLYCDHIERPRPLITHRDKDDGGMGVHDPEWKTRAFYTRSFLETAIIPGYNHSLYHTALYDQHVLDEVVSPILPNNPYFNVHFFNNIKRAITDGHDPITMTTKDWYIYFLSKDQTENNTGNKVMCKIEEKYPLWNWGMIWKRVIIKGITNDKKSFIWRLIHDLIPTHDRCAKVNQHLSPNCTNCDTEKVDSILLHTFTDCSYTVEVITWMMKILSFLNTRCDIIEAITFRFNNPSHIYNLCTTMCLVDI